MRRCHPRGYRRWFDDRAARAAVTLAEKRQEPLPNNDPAYAKAVLKKAVQLMKRRRDLMIRDDAVSPRSVVLTTLAAIYYGGQRDVARALAGILSGISSEIDARRPGRIEVCNPTNPDERFCESFRTGEQYEAFVDFITQFGGEVETLLTITGFPELDEPLSRMFGERITKRALTEFSKRLTDARTSGNLQVDS